MIYRFGEFELDRKRYRMLRAGEPIHIEPLALDLLAYLIEHRDRLVAKEELLDKLWADRYVGDAVLARCVHEARLALGEDAATQDFIQTIRGRGYGFDGDVEEIADEACAKKTTATVQPRARPSPSRDALLLEAELAALGTVPTRSRRPGKVLLAAGAAALLVLLVLTAILVPLSRAPRPPPLEVAQTPSLAVLPFVDLSTEQDQQSLADGLAEELINTLSKIEGLRVVARTSSFSFRDRPVDLPVIAGQLDVVNVVQGSVSRSDDRVRIAVQLVRASDSSHIWSEQYERELEDLFELQSSISQAILSQLVPRLAGTSPATPVARASAGSLEVYELLFRARQHVHRATRTDLETAIELLQQAVDLDPEFAPAWASLAEQYTGLLGLVDWRRRLEVLDQARTAAQTALALDPASADAHAALAFVLLHGDWNRESAEVAARRAVELNPGSSDAQHRLGLVLSAFPRWERAIVHLGKAVDLDPFAVTTKTRFGLALRGTGRNEEALGQLRRTLELDPDFIPARTWLLESYRLMGMESEAVAEQLELYHRVGEGPPPIPHLARVEQELRRVYAESGASAFWRRQLDHQLHEHQMERVPFWRGLGDPMMIGISYGFLNEWDEAMLWWEHARAEHHPMVVFLEALVSERWPELRSDPEFEHFLRRLGVIGAPSSS